MAGAPVQGTQPAPPITRVWPGPAWALTWPGGAEGTAHYPHVAWPGLGSDLAGRGEGTAHHQHMAWACLGSDLAGRGGGRRSRGPRRCCPLSRADLTVSAGKGDAFTGLWPLSGTALTPLSASPCRAGLLLFRAQPPSISVPSRGLSSLSPLLNRGGIEAEKHGQAVGFCRRPHLESEWSSRRSAPRPGEPLTVEDFVVSGIRHEEL